VTQLDPTVDVMSTYDSTSPDQNRTVTGPRGRLMSFPLALVFVSIAGTLTSFYLLVSVTPMDVEAAGAGTAEAGLVTGVLLLGTVAAELASSVLMRRFGYRMVMAAGAVLLGAPSLALLGHGSVPVIVAAAVVRGFGFGLGTVVCGALTAVLLPADRRGEGLGLLGIADGVPAIVALPAGVWLASHVGFGLVIGLTAVTAFIPLIAIPWLPGRAANRGGSSAAAGDQAGPSLGLLAGLRQPGQLRVALIFAASTVAAGVVVSFLPLAAGVSHNVAATGLLAQALTATGAAWWAGRIGDRRGHGRLLGPALVVAAAGIMAMLLLAVPAAVIAGMVLFGAGFGVLQNATFTLMIERMPASGAGAASAIWSLAYDTGYGAGPAVFGVFVGATGYPAAFALTGVLMLVALPAARREYRTPASAAPAEPATRQLTTGRLTTGQLTTGQLATGQSAATSRHREPTCAR
jgi:MFS family permease